MQLKVPTLIIDESICKANIKKMALKAEQSNVVFRPHFKTHQSAEIGNWFRDIGVEKITVSSVQMANYFYTAGWKDILIAFPVNLNEIEKINFLAQQINLSLTVESLYSISDLLDKLVHPVGIYLKIDTGYHRTGLEPDQMDESDKILDAILSSKLARFCGFLTHAGHTYDAKSTQEIKHIHDTSLRILQDIKTRYSGSCPDSIISIGDTPSCSVVNDVNGANEIRPGNFVFYDLIQFYLGACRIDDIGVILACPVVAKHPSRQEIVVYGGAVHLSKESILVNGKKLYGRVVPLYNYSWGKPYSNSLVSSVSQEHGIIKASPDLFENVQIGDRLGILPVHSCLTANLAGEYVTTKEEVLSKMRYI